MSDGKKVKAIINLAHGEGFGLPLFEAARHGLPVITCGYSGQPDFLYDKATPLFQEVGFTMGPVSKQSVWPGVIEAEANWCYADQGSYKMILRKTRKKWKKAKDLAIKLQSFVNENFVEEKLYEQFCDSIYKPNPEMDEWLDDIQEMENL